MGKYIHTYEALLHAWVDGVLPGLLQPHLVQVGTATYPEATQAELQQG